MKLSIFMVTYNHEKFLAQALDSALMQTVNFDYEIIVGEDCSTDNTRSILMDYYSKFPDRIKPILHEQNIGPHENTASVFAACTGEYVALLEGDDYWTDPLKLQKQVDFLDANRDYSLCFSAYQRYYENDRTFSDPIYPPGRKQWYSLEELLHECMISTPTVLFRRNNLPVFNEFLQKIPAPDYGIFIINAQHGKLGYIDEVTSVYRRHEGGIWTSLQEKALCEKTLESLLLISEYLGPQYHKYLCFANYEYNYKLMELHILDNNTRLACKHSRLCIQNKTAITNYEKIKLYLKPFVPYRLWYALNIFRSTLGLRH